MRSLCVRGHSGGSTINGVATGLRNTGDATAWWAALFWDALTRGGVFAGSRFVSVYWHCPCAGRHLLSLLLQRK